MRNYHILLGGNLGDRTKLIQQAHQFITERCGTIVKQSSLYETKAWGVENQPDFLNQVIILKTPLTPHHLLKELQEVELLLGRERHHKWHARTMDIDILYAEGESIDTTDLKVPHPQISFRRFTLVPLKELDPDFIHPTLSKSQSVLLDECTDTLEVKRYSEALH